MFILVSILFSAYCPQGPQWSSLDKSTRLFTFVLHCSILHLPTGLDTSFGVNIFIKFIRNFIFGLYLRLYLRLYLELQDKSRDYISIDNYIYTYFLFNYIQLTIFYSHLIDGKKGAIELFREIFLLKYLKPPPGEFR